MIPLPMATKDLYAVGKSNCKDPKLVTHQSHFTIIFSLHSLLHVNEFSHIDFNRGESALKVQFELNVGTRLVLNA